MGIYRQLYGKVIEPLLHEQCEKEGAFHGSSVRDLFIDKVAKGNWAVDNHAEKLLLELVNEDSLEVLLKDPTKSQAAFIGLQYTQDQYNKLPLMTPGIVEHNWFKWKNED
jgi:hypothetical protein